MATKKIFVISAACRNNGIGAKGDLPWRLKNEMAFFTKMTKTTADVNKKNAVIMGRRTWDCIPQKYRPLPGRVNVVLSEQMKEKPSGADYLFNNLSDAVDALSQVDNIEKLFVIGGERVYKNAIESPYLSRIYLTRIDADFDCDAFFPQFNIEEFAEVSDEDVPVGVHNEKGLEYRFHVYERINKSSQ